MIAASSVGLALGVVNSAVKLGRRVDLIRVQYKLGNPLPLQLPNTPPNFSDKIDEMIAFFNGAEGQSVLTDDAELKGLWDKLQTAITADNGPEILRLAKILTTNWALLVGQSIPKMGEAVNLPPEPSQMAMVQYYMVEAAPPGQGRSVITDIALATADVALEFVGGNPAIITKDPTVQKAIGSFLQHFTQGDLEKLAYRQLFERTLSSVIRTAIEHRDLVEDEKALSVFLEALADAQKANPDFVAGLVAGKGFDKLLQSVIETLGENLDQFTSDQVVIDIVGGILKDVAQDDVFKAILKGDDVALAAVAQITVAHVAKHPVLLDKIGNDEVWHSALKEVLQKVVEHAEGKTLFTDKALGSLVRAALRGVAQNKDLLQGDFVERLVASVADSLSKQPVKALFGHGSLKIIASSVLDAAAEHVEFLIEDDKLLAAILGAVMEEGAKGFKAGFDRDFAIDLAIAAIDAVADNVSSIKLPDVYGSILGTVLAELSRDDLRKNLTRGDIIAIFTDSIRIIAANPHLWEAQLANGKVPASVVRSIAKAVASDPTKLLTGPVLGSLVVEALDAVSLRAKAYATVIADENKELSELLTVTLSRLQSEVGVSLGANNIVSVIIQIVLAWGKDPFLVQVGDQDFENHIGNALIAA